MVLTITPRNEEITGASLTGTEPGTNRTYALANTNSIINGMSIIISNTVLQYTTDFTFSSGVITFLNPVWDNQVITINYFTQTGSGSFSGNNSTTLDVVRTAGIGVNVQNEAVGVGDNSNKSFSLDNGNVIALSYILKYGVASGNDVNELTELTETTHYTIDKNSGDILFTVVGVAELGTNILYADYVHSPKLNDDEVNHMLERAEDEIELKTGNYWGEVKTTTEVLDGRETGRYPTTDYPYVDSDPDEEDWLQLKYKGVTGITSVKFLATGGAGTDLTLSSTSYSFTEQGKIVLHTNTLPIGKLAVQVVYTHGYTTPPTYIKQLTELLASIMIFSNITGGSYDDATVFSLGRKSISIGEVYVNVREVVKQLDERIQLLLNKIGNNLVVI